MSFKKFKNINDDLKNLGFDYTNKILKKTTSSVLWENKNSANLLEKYELCLTAWVDSVKKIKVFFNFTVDKNYKNIN